MTKAKVAKVVLTAAGAAVAVAKSGVVGADVASALTQGAGLVALLMHFLHIG